MNKSADADDEASEEVKGGDAVPAGERKVQKSNAELKATLGKKKTKRQPDSEEKKEEKSAQD